MIENSTGRKMKCLRTDNGGEYISNEFQKLLKKEGIKHQRTVPKTPEQNGISERLNRTLMETVRSIYLMLSFLNVSGQKHCQLLYI